MINVKRVRSRQVRYAILSAFGTKPCPHGLHKIGVFGILRSAWGQSSTPLANSPSILKRTLKRPQQAPCSPPSNKSFDSSTFGTVRFKSPLQNSGIHGRCKSRAYQQIPRVLKKRPPRLSLSSPMFFSGNVCFRIPASAADEIHFCRR